MAELLFGSVPQLWTSVPTPGFTPLLGLTANRPGMFLQPPPEPASGMSPSPPNVEFATGITAQALLAAVAVRRGQPAGPASDQDVEDFIYDALELLPGANDLEVRCEGGRVVLTGTAPHKRLKRDVGEVAWTIPTVNDVQNNVTIATRRRSRTQGRETEGATGAPSRKTA